MCIKSAHWGLENYKVEKEGIEPKESTKSVTIVAVVRPQILDQSNSSLTKEPINWSIELALSSKILLLRSFHIVHIKHKGTKFHTPDICFPNRFRHLNNESTTFSPSTHWIPKNLKIKRHKWDTKLQCNRRWSTVSPADQHIQHHPAIE